MGLSRFGPEVEEQLTIAAHYDGYIKRQHEEIRRMRGLERTELPPWTRDPRRIAELAGRVSGLVEAEHEQVVYLPRTPVAPARDLMFLAEATGDADGRQRP